jgi:RNA polymerase sigma-70 factor (ECF subfamily)
MEMLAVSASDLQHPACALPAIPSQRSGRIRGLGSRIPRQAGPDNVIASKPIGKEWALVQQAIAGDADGLEALFTPHLDGLYRMAHLMLRNKEDAEDALQSGLCNACGNLSSFQGRSSFSTWLTRIVMNSALTALRRKKSHPESSLDEILDNRTVWQAPIGVDSAPNPEQACALAELKALVEEQMQKLTESEQAAFRHFAIKGFSLREASLSLRIPAATFKSRVYRTRRKLGQGLQSSLGKAYALSTKGKSTHGARR